jgi:hypothetical protein
MDFDNHQRLNLVLLGLLIASCCVYFSIYDFRVEKIWWSTLYIYIPCGAIFFSGYLVWLRPTVAGLTVMLAFLVGIDLFLSGYGSLLTAQGEMLWGPLTLGFRD